MSKINRREMMNRIAAGAALAGGFGGSASAKSGGFEHELPEAQRLELLQPYTDDAFAEQVFDEKTADVREKLVEDGHLDAPDLGIEDVVRDGRPDLEDFGTLGLSVVWNREKERGAVFFEKRFDAGDYQVKVSANLTADTASALILDEETEGLQRYRSTDDDVVSIQTQCGDGDDCWTDCTTTECNECCGEFGTPKNYRLAFACVENGTVTDTTCLCSYCDWEYSCCFDCADGAYHGGREGCTCCDTL